MVKEDQVGGSDPFNALLFNILFEGIISKHI